MRSDWAQKHGAFKWATFSSSSSSSSSLPSKGHKLRLKLPRVWGANPRRGSAPSTTEANVPTTQVEVETAPPTPEPAPPMTFEQHLSSLRLSEAGRMLLLREERLFGEDATDGWRAEETAALKADRLALEEVVLRTLRSSLEPAADVDVLASAVAFVQQEEEQDRLWERRGGMLPPWRLSGWRKMHNDTLQQMVEERLEAPQTPLATPPKGQSSIQADVHGAGRRLRRDLQIVAERVKACYPQHFRICQLYAASYHRGVSSRLRRLADFGLDDQDCTFLLHWVNDFYPRLLEDPQLEINMEVLEPLLPEELLSPLEEQYLGRQERELSTYMGSVLDEARAAWNKGQQPPVEDGCFVSHTAYDIIQIVNGMVSRAEKVLGDLRKAQPLTCQLQDFLHSFQTFQADVIKYDKANTAAYVKANLGCVADFRDFVISRRRLFPEEVLQNCLSILTDMKGSAHEYLLAPVRKNLKPHFRKLFSQDWLKNSTLEKLQSGLDQEILRLRGLPESRRQELIGQMHRVVSTEYVRRLLKGKLRLKDKQQQQKAAANVEDDAHALQCFFSTHGSEEVGLADVLSMMAEVLKLQDLPAIQCQVASLASAFPDFSEEHVLALLKLKGNLGREERNSVKAVLSEIPKSSAQSQPFFSLVQLK
ncbi:tumor necrosis factor alpha-induced protein 2 [Corythoichthys intestinalis]|uniref:tumor necrosis factor alpha-induced protein 2 n=1 Tax=Corythoichthys intestinalis TaxID=161448 RepID=UPI0025A5B7BD|nr:tumor necrosis factor alpha-induced protein 2 [Corythoichthys intestinalis]XP_061798713.1 tumor necrosis factor alpha-induced protein 2-like [Nerophis lumbriciformis]